MRVARPGTELVIVGSPVLGQDGYAADLRARVADTPGARLLDARDDIPDVMADLDVLAFPSIEPESYGLVLVEALASGTPVVATDHGGPPEIVARATTGTARAVRARRRRCARHRAPRPAARAHVAANAAGPACLRSRPSPPRFAEVFAEVAARSGR